jgi:hypothetical protein
LCGCGGSALWKRRDRIAIGKAFRARVPAGERAVARGRDVLARLDLVRVNDQILDDAGRLLRIEIRSLVCTLDRGVRCRLRSRRRAGGRRASHEARGQAVAVSR